MALLFYLREMWVSSSITLGVIENTLRVNSNTLGVIIHRVSYPTSAIPQEDGP